MDELSQITEYIQEQAGDECEVIFGHGVDPALGNSIRVTVIATGFAGEGRSTAKKAEEKKILDLEKSLPLSEVADNSVNERNQEIELIIADEMIFTVPVKDEPFFDFIEEVKTETKPVEDVPIMKMPEEKLVPAIVEVRTEVKPEEKTEEKPLYVKPETKPIKKEETPLEERHYTLSLFDQQEVVAKKLDDDDDNEDDIEKSNEDDDEFDVGREVSADQVINEEGMMEVRKTKARLEQQAKERRDRLKAAKKQEMSKEEFNEKWTLPAYLRRGVKMENVPHSSERFISKYNLNDDNNLLGNNKFLHDNVD